MNEVIKETKLSLSLSLINDMIFMKRQPSLRKPKTLSLPPSLSSYLPPPPFNHT